MIDFHVHLGSVKSYSKFLKGFVSASVADLIQYMDENNVKKAVILSVTRHYEDIGEFIKGTEEVLREIEDEAERLIPFFALDPLEEDVQEKIRHYVSIGCKGFGEHKVELPVDHPLSMRIYRICGDLGIPVLLHIDSRFNPDVRIFEKVLEKLPNTTFIAHGPGWWKEISSEPSEDVYPKGQIKSGGRVDEILANYHNAYADISATSGLNALTRDIEFSKAFLKKNWNKVLFGTDFPCISEDGTQFGPGGHHVKVLRQLLTDQDILHAILKGNAERLLGL